MDAFAHLEAIREKFCYELLSVGERESSEAARTCEDPAAHTDQVAVVSALRDRERCMEDIDALSKLVPIYVDHSSRLMTLWTIQVAAFIGVVGWVISHRAELNRMLPRVYLISMVAAFGLYTWYSALSATAHKEAVWKLLIEEVSSARGLSSQKHPLCDAGSSSEGGDRDALAQYVCTLEPHAFWTKSVGIVVVNAITVAFIFFWPVTGRGQGNCPDSECEPGASRRNAN